MIEPPPAFPPPHVGGLGNPDPVPSPPPPAPQVPEPASVVGGLTALAAAALWKRKKAPAAV